MNTELQPKAVDVLIENGLIITVDKGRRIIHDGAIAVKDDLIIEVGKTEDLKNRYHAVKRINAKDRVVMPGFVDAHMHLTEGARGFVPDNIQALPWIYEWICPIFGCLTPDEEYLLSRLVTTEALKTGTTTFVEGGTLKYPEMAIQAIKETGIRANLGRWTWDNPQEPEIFRQTVDGAVDYYENLIKKWHGAENGLINIWMHMVGVGSQSDELFRAMKDLADKNGLGISQHQSNVEEEVQQWMEINKTSKRPMEYFADLGFLDKNVRFIHMIALSKREVELVRQFDVKPVHSVLCALNCGYGATVDSRYPEMIDMGVSVSLGCDGANCSNCFDMVRAMYVLAGIYKDRYKDCTKVSAEQAIEIATLGGAESILMQDQIGSLEAGKKADITLFDCNRPEWLPMVNVTNNLVYSADGRSVDTVLVNGRVVVEGGRITSFDEDELYAEIRSIDWGALLSERTGLPLEKRWPEL